MTDSPRPHDVPVPLVEPAGNGWNRVPSWMVPWSPPPQGGVPGTRGVQATGWLRVGLASGHAPGLCEECGAIALIERTHHRRCWMTPGCEGVIQAPVGFPTPLQALRRGLITIDDIRRWPPTDIGVQLRKLLLAARR